MLAECIRRYLRHRCLRRPRITTLASSLRIDPEQRFSCAQCGRCCRRWDVLVTGAERDRYVRRGVARWFRETEAGAEGTSRDPFEAVPGWRGYHRIRSRA